MRIEYVTSGLSFPRFNAINEDSHPEILERIQDWVHKIADKHRFGFLYNAFQEKSYPNFLKHYDIPIYADSGGLQMITKGVDITKAKREEIYEAQMFADYAFCLDEVPIERIDKKRRIVLKDKFFEKGQITGKNIKEQVEYFRNHNAKTKVFIIAQGQELEDYDNYIQGILGELAPEDYDYIAGFAYSIACGGGRNYSFLKAILASMNLEKYDIPDRVKRRIHYLGFGAINKFIIIREMAKHFNLDLDVSADSTTLALNYIMGHYQGAGYKRDIRRYNEDYLQDDVKDEILEMIFSEIRNLIKKYDLGVDDEEFKRIRRMLIIGTYRPMSTYEYQEKLEYLQGLVLYFLVQVDNLMEIVDNNGIELPEDMDGYPYHLLFKVKTIEEVDKMIGKVVKKPNTIYPRISAESQEKRSKFNNLF